MKTKDGSEKPTPRGKAGGNHADTLTLPQRKAMWFRKYGNWVVDPRPRPKNLTYKGR